MGSVHIRNLAVLSPRVRNQGFGIHELPAYHKQQSSRKGSDGRPGMGTRASGMPGVEPSFPPGPSGRFSPWSRHVRRDRLRMLAVHLCPAALSQGHFSQKCALFVNPCVSALGHVTRLISFTRTTVKIMGCSDAGSREAKGKRVRPRGRPRTWAGPGRRARCSHWGQGVWEGRTVPEGVS